MRFWQAIGFTDMGELDALAQCAEALGFFGVALGDHWVTAAEPMDRYEAATDDGKPPWSASVHWPDPWVQFAALAKITTHLEFLTTVYILPMRDVFSAAKAISTAAVISGGRVHLGVGVGWQALEFSLGRWPFEKRGRHVDEQLGLLRRLWTGEMVEHHGEFYDFPPLQMTPPPPREIPILIGGLSPAAFARAARHAGWAGALYDFDELVAHIKAVKAACTAAGGSLEGFRILGGCFDPTPERLQELRALGLTDFLKPPWTTDIRPSGVLLAEKLAEMEAFAATYLG